MDFFAFEQMQIAFQLILAAFLGGLVGLEREAQERAAGLRTNCLVCLGAALFTLISSNAFNSLLDNPGVRFDPSRVVSTIVMGVGFIGAGLIIYRKFRVEGLTTAAGIWTVAGIGVAVGAGLYFVAVFATFLVLVILNVLRILEERFFGKDKDIFYKESR